MAAMEMLHQLLQIDSDKLSKYEFLLLEGNFFSSICKEIKEYMRDKYRKYFQLMNYDKKMEDEMLDTNFARFIINDILTTEEYSLNGIAYYTDTHEDIVQELYDGRNTNPTVKFLCRIIEIHRQIRPEVYREIMSKVIKNFTALTTTSYINH